MTWRRTVLAAGWIGTAGSGISPNTSGRAIMTLRPSVPLALAGTFLAGAYTRLAIGFATPEIVFAPLGPIVAVALGDASSTRTTFPPRSRSALASPRSSGSRRGVEP